MNFEMIAVLNGSISVADPAQSPANKASASTAVAAMYLPIHRRFSSVAEGLHCGTPRAREAWARSSWRAPNGHNQPQNTPRPISTTEISV